MNRVPATLPLRLLLIQLAVGAFALLFVVVFASRLLLIGPLVVWTTLPVTAASAALLLLFACLFTVFLTAPVKPALRFLATEVKARPDDQDLSLTPTDLLKIYDIPARLTVLDGLAATTIAALTLLRPFRAPTLDLATQLSLVLLALTFASAALLPLYVMLRSQVAMVLEVAPLWAVREALARAARRRQPVLVRRRLIFAVAIPVAFVALGDSLLVQAHVRAFDADSRLDDATKLAEGAFDVFGSSALGRAAALDAAAAHAIHATIEPRRASFHVSRDQDGVTSVTVPLDEGHAELTFETTHFSAALWVIYAFLAVVAVTLAGLLGSRLGSGFALDLSLVTRAVRETGAADVLRGSRVRRESRFDSVILLMDAVDSLGGVFRQFAAAQERAIEARAATERMRGLFLASMSHDLKGPLNAILGFAELVAQSPLSAAQRESLTIIEQRGRELLTLIHTVLDSARVEAGELRVLPEWTMVGDVVMSAVLEARDLAAGSNVEIVAEIQPGVPQLFVDGSRLVQALTAVIQSAVRFTEQGTVHVRATVPAGSSDLRVDVESSGRTVPGSEREKLFDAFKDSDRARRHGSLGLGLSLARSIVALHGGSLDVAVTKLGGTVFHVSVPTESARVLSALQDR